MSPAEEYIIDIRGVTKHFGDIKAVDSLDMQVRKGDIYGFLGPNGSGKSTTIRMMLSLVHPDQGTLKLFGQTLSANKREILARTGAMIEKPDFYEYLSAHKNLELLLRYSGKKVDPSRIMEVLELVGLKQRAHSKVRTYSKGMKQRLGIAQAIVHDPELIILDEPGSGLDPSGIRDIRNLILYLNREKGKTILLSSHLLFEVEQIANQMIIIHHGKKIVEGPVSELMDRMVQNVILEVRDAAKALDVINRSNLVKGKPELMHGDRILLLMQKEDIPTLNKELHRQEVEVISLHRAQSLEEFFINLI